MEVLHDVVFGTGGGRPLHAEIARPKDPAMKPMPAVIWIHGGGWEKGTYKDNPAAFLASHGYFTASIEYRLSGEAIWPAQIEDCKLAVRWLRANAVKYNIDPNHIGCWGHSAGGHLAACLGTMGDQAQWEGGGGYPGTSSQVQAVVDMSGPVDLTMFGRIEDQKPNNGHHRFLGVAYKERPDVWRQASPIFQIKADDPPFLIVHGDRDKTVPYAQSENFAAALQKNGVSVQFLTIHGGGHELKAAAGQPPAQPAKDERNRIILAFFDKNLKT